MVNVGIVGFGYAGKYFHSYLVNLAEGLNLYAIVSSSEEKRKEAEKLYGVKTYKNIDELLEDKDVSLVVLATPHNTHFELSIKAMEAGKNVVVDKVMCMNGRQADEMIKKAREKGVLLSVFQNRRWDRDFLTVKKIIQEKTIGKIHRIESAITGYGKPGGWRGKKEESGGILYDWGAHLVDQAMIIGNYQIDTVWCEIQNFGKWEDVDIGNVGRIVMKFKDGLTYEIFITNLSKFEKPRWVLYGDSGTAVKYGVDPQERAMINGDIDKAEEIVENFMRVWKEKNGEFEMILMPSVKGTWKSFYKNISDVLNREEDLAVKPEECRKCMYVYDSAMRSASGNKVEKVIIPPLQ